MNQVITDFANFAAAVVGVVVQSIPEPNTPPYFIMLGTLLMLLALLFMWLLIRMRRRRLARAADAAFAPEVTFDDISAEAAAAQPRMAEEPDMQGAGPAGDARVAAEAAPDPGLAAGIEPDVATDVAQDESARPSDGERGEAPAGGFRFFKRKSKTSPDGASAQSVEDDVFLLGLEQEMLATRQLYLDGLITKDVYVTETRALYDKAQSRMT